MMVKMKPKMTLLRKCLDDDNAEDKSVMMLPRKILPKSRKLVAMLLMMPMMTLSGKEVLTAMMKRKR